MENRIMTKEELKQEAEEYYEDETEGTFQICEDCYWFADAVKTAYVDSAEPREKRIAELEKQLEQEKNLNQVYEDNDRQLRELIEKMKCCENCALHCASPITIKNCIDNSHSKWELED